MTLTSATPGVAAMTAEPMSITQAASAVAGTLAPVRLTRDASPTSSAAMTGAAVHAQHPAGEGALALS